MKQKLWLVAGTCLVMGAGLVGGLMLAGKTAVGTVATMDGRLRNPLEIEAMRARQYPGGAITTVEDLGTRGACSTYIVSYPSDGLTLRSMMSVPPGGKPAGGYPTLILNHGYIEPSAYRTAGTDYQGFIDYYCSRGYLVFKPDYRGHDQSQGTAEGGHFSPGYTYDVLNLLASIKQGDLSSSKFCMLGHSMGGHVTLRAIAVSGDIACSIMVSGVVGSAEDIVYNWKRNDVNAMTTAPPDLQAIRQRVIDALGSDRGRDSLWYKISAINYLQNIAGPVQIDYGTADTVVPNEFSLHLDSALTAEGKAHETFAYEGEDHQFGAPSGKALFLQRSLVFLNTNLNQ